MRLPLVRPAAIRPRIPLYSGPGEEEEDPSVEDPRSTSVFTEGKCYVAMPMIVYI